MFSQWPPQGVLSQRDAAARAWYLGKKGVEMPGECPREGRPHVGNKGRAAHAIVRKLSISSAGSSIHKRWGSETRACTDWTTTTVLPSLPRRNSHGGILPPFSHGWVDPRTLPQQDRAT